MGANNLVKVEQKWTESTKEVLELQKTTKAQQSQIRHEDLMANELHDIQ